ncbi:hypothetical protein POV27_18430 [Aureisphaera galaxeae]|uniref:hypothetical protein n=1 Tax=Aureisphaera galaxeae TaxID=1538023 RepID=UPI002350DB72|nr:hypothetical protein [Aureisphaera galaxeae]MDC8006035.1 hypothetical protein [Aureisphaera galaxeae]
MGVPEKAMKAAIDGPEAKKLKISEVGSSKKHEFNVKPVSMSVNCDGEFIVYGQISHCLKFRKDDQCYFLFKKKRTAVTPSSPNKMIVEKKDGGLVKTITGPLKPIGIAVGAYFGQDVSKYFDMLDKHADKLSFVDMDSGWESAVRNYLAVLSKRIGSPRPLRKQGLTLFQHHMFKGKTKAIKVGQNITHLKSSGWNDRASSLKALVPKGMKLEVFKHDNFKGDKIEFGCGSHFIRDLKIHKLGDELTSVRWSKA